MDPIYIDENWIKEMAEGSGEAFRRFYAATDKAVYGLALSLLKDRHLAADVMHDTYIRAYEKAGTYRRKGKPLAWLLAITRNLCYDRLRQAGREFPSDGEGLPEPAAPDDVAGGSVDRMLLQTALSVLSEEERQIVILHAVTGLKHREIAELLEIPLGTVLSKYSRSMSKMRDELTETGVTL